MRRSGSRRARPRRLPLGRPVTRRRRRCRRSTAVAAGARAAEGDQPDALRLGGAVVGGLGCRRAAGRPAAVGVARSSPPTWRSATIARDRARRGSAAGPSTAERRAGACARAGSAGHRRGSARARARVDLVDALAAVARSRSTRRVALGVAGSGDRGRVVAVQALRRPRPPARAVGVGRLGRDAARPATRSSATRSSRRSSASVPRISAISSSLMPRLTDRSISARESGSRSFEHAGGV